MAYLLSDPTFWAMVGLVLFFGVLVWQKVPGAIAKMLDNRADTIRKELEEARRLREEAQELLASFQRKQREAEAEADAIVAQAKKDAKSMRAEARKELAERLDRRTAMAEQRIAQAEVHATQEIRALAADLAVDAAAKLLGEKLSKKQISDQIKADLETLEQRLN
ncbi:MULTISPECIES: F0F1 ATP synthase subunit B family protein [Hyphobacterium]|uniref:ATP synthase subunit b n=1 Tax=Hyphobacterium vulgare TaxID=1736751 RepID=A0ABV6ZYS8_9PROT